MRIDYTCLIWKWAKNDCVSVEIVEFAHIGVFKYIFSLRVKIMANIY